MRLKERLRLLREVLSRADGIALVRKRYIKTDTHYFTTAFGMGHYQDGPMLIGTFQNLDRHNLISEANRIVDEQLASGKNSNENGIQN